MVNSEKQANRNILATELLRIRQALEAKIETNSTLKDPSDCQQNYLIQKLELSYLGSSALGNTSTETIEFLCQNFELSSFERDILLLCAGVELDLSWQVLCAIAQGDPNKKYPTFSLALSIFKNSHWDAFAPNSPLRRWQLIKIKPSLNLVDSPLAIDEQILNYILKIQHSNEGLLSLISPVKINSYLMPSHQKIAENLFRSWIQINNPPYPLIQLGGKDLESKKALAALVCQRLDLQLYTVSVLKLPKSRNEMHSITCLLEREWILNDLIFVLDCEDLGNERTEKKIIISDLIAALNCPLILLTREQIYFEERPLISWQIDLPTSNEQKMLWQELLKNLEVDLRETIDKIVSHFPFNSATISTIAKQLETLNEGEEVSELLWKSCRSFARPRLDELAQRIDSKVSWEDLILSEENKDILREIAIHVRQKNQIKENWGWGLKSSRGNGISALFSGISGTGKTLAAEVLANELNLDVYRIDLSAVVSKYIGETEKNLREIFDRAERCGVILLFDEADALFGKRSQVKDSHDRYANMEVSYLLQRIESYRGLAILTTNLKDDIDRAFLRRIRFVIEFRFPDPTLREAIWQRIFPSQTPTENLNFKKLAQLNVAGGNIRNIAMKAAFLAADAGENVTMKHILQATENEYFKLQKTLTPGEVKNWIVKDPK